MRVRDPRLRQFWHRAGPLGAIAALAAIGGASQGCGGGGSGGSGGSGGGSMTTTSTTGTTTSMTTTSTTGTTTTSTTGTTTTSTTSTTGTGGMNNCVPATFGGDIAPGANGGFSDAFDAVPNAMGTTVFFTGIDMNGNPGVFKQDICPAGAVAAVYTGGAFELPHGIAISSDDMTLYVADTSAAEDLTTMGPDNGILFSLPAAGGQAPTALVSSVSPRSLFVNQENGSDVIYFTGIDKANGFPGVFKVAAAGGSVTVVAEGTAFTTPAGPFNDPGGVAVAGNGDVYVLDTTGSSTLLGNIILVPHGTNAGSQLVGNIQVGYPAGIALQKDDSTLLVSGLDPTAGSDALVEVAVATMAVTNVTTGIGTYAEAAGLHRARMVDVFAWADTKATPMGLTGTGTVFVIK